MPWFRAPARSPTSRWPSRCCCRACCCRSCCAGRAPSRRRRPPALLIAVQGTGTLVIGAGLALTGIGLIAILGPQLLTQPWLLVALRHLRGQPAGRRVRVSRPNLRRLHAASAPERRRGTWRAPRAQQRYVAYGMAAATGVIGFLMSAKPGAVVSRAAQKCGSGSGRPMDPEEPGHDQRAGRVTKNPNQRRTSRWCARLRHRPAADLPRATADSTPAGPPRTVSAAL